MLIFGFWKTWIQIFTSPGLTAIAKQTWRSCWAYLAHFQNEETISHYCPQPCIFPITIPFKSSHVSAQTLLSWKIWQVLHLPNALILPNHSTFFPYYSLGSKSCTILWSPMHWWLRLIELFLFLNLGRPPEDTGCISFLWGWLGNPENLP
jgi:hypothetical protein